MNTDGKELWKPALMVWRWEDAPAELRELFGEEQGDEESLIYLPASLLDGDREYDSPTSGLNFLSFPGDDPSHMQFADDGWGVYKTCDLRDGSRVAVTSESAWGTGSSLRPSPN